MACDPLETWTDLVAAIISAASFEWSHTEALKFWRKSPDGDLVSDLDLRIDLAIRHALRDRCPQLPVLSEELSWLLPVEDGSTAWAIVIDSIDGTESLIQGHDSWWVSVALVERGVPRAGLLYQPTTGVAHDSQLPRALSLARPAIGMSPDQTDDESTEAIRRRLGRHGLDVEAVPHAVEKVAAVLEGRCQASLYLPSAKSPGWHSWDLAAGLAVADASGIVLRATDGSRLELDDLDAVKSTPWICARNEGLWDVTQAAVTG